MKTQMILGVGANLIWIMLVLLLAYDNINGAKTITKHRKTPVQGHYEIHGKRLECPFEPLLLSNLSCQMKRINRTAENWSFDAFIKPGIKADNLIVKFTIFRKMSSQQYRPYLVINVTFDVCSYLNGNPLSPILNIFTAELKEYSNVFHPCPLEGHLYISNHTMNVLDFPPILPTGEFHGQYIFVTKVKGKDHVPFQMLSYFDIVPKGIERF